MSAFPRSDAFIAEIRAEFPSFAILPKRGSRLQRAIDVALKLVTLGGQRSYMTRYHTVLFGRLWVPDSWDAMRDDARFILLRHERVHLRQRARMGDVVMGFVYLVPLLPARPRVRARAHRVGGVRRDHPRDLQSPRPKRPRRRLRSEIVPRFTGPDYGWMWPFPRADQPMVRRPMGTLPAEG